MSVYMAILVKDDIRRRIIFRSSLIACLNTRSSSLNPSLKKLSLFSWKVFMLGIKGESNLYVYSLCFFVLALVPTLIGTC
jgi:hypothetical protein